MPGQNFFFCSSVVLQDGTNGLEGDRRQWDVGTLRLIDENGLLYGPQTVAADSFGQPTPSLPSVPIRLMIAR